MNRTLRRRRAVAVTIMLISGLLIGTFGCDERTNSSSKVLSSPPPAKDITYVGDPARVGTMAKAALYFLRKHQWCDLETTVRALIAANEKARDDRALIGNYVLLGIALRMQGKKAQEIDAYGRELETARRLTPPDAAAECDALTNIGNALAEKQNFERAAAAFKEAREIARRNNLHDLLASIENNLTLAKARVAPPRGSMLWGDFPTIRAGVLECDMGQARSLAANARELVKGNVAFNMCARAVEQPDFPGVIGEEGGIVTFDGQGNPNHVLTTRQVDYRTGLRVDTRELTREEIIGVVSALKRYHSKIDPNGTTILIVSDSFKAAACETLSNADEKTLYSLKRNGVEAQLHKVQGGLDEVIASEAIYYESSGESGK